MSYGGKSFFKIAPDLLGIALDIENGGLSSVVHRVQCGIKN
jgi:hypothetical protein